VISKDTPSFVDDGSDAEPLLCGFCVTGSVTVRSERDEQDETGHDLEIEGYLPERADFTGKIVKSTDGATSFSRPPPSTTRPSLCVRILWQFYATRLVLPLADHQVSPDPNPPRTFRRVCQAAGRIARAQVFVVA
jgi:hypothetical protein